ncbi:MAG: PorT family protein [Flavobacteriales bacterium]|nr:PorT family protein [Flavobacteriales bacterium]
MKLKKAIALITIIGSLIPLSIKAQESKVGVKGGLNFSNFYNKEVDDQDIRTGIQAGLFFKAALTDFVSIQPELIYTNKGSTTKYDNFITGEGDFSQKLDYIELPVLLLVNLNENLNIHAGPYFAYLLKASIDNKSENSNFNFVEDLNEGDFERVDYGLSVGVGFEFEVLNFGLRYDYGLKEIGKDQRFTTNGSEYSSNAFKNSRNSTFSVYLGLGF